MVSYIVQDEPNYVNFSIDYLIRTIYLLSRVLYNMISSKSKSVKVLRFPSFISLRLSKGILVKLKFNMKTSNNKKLYA